jgi:hypothetical protein
MAIFHYDKAQPKAAWGANQEILLPVDESAIESGPSPPQGGGSFVAWQLMKNQAVTNKGGSLHA